MNLIIWLCWFKFFWKKNSIKLNFWYVYRDKLSTSLFKSLSMLLHFLSCLALSRWFLFYFFVDWAHSKQALYFLIIWRIFFGNDRKNRTIFTSCFDLTESNNSNNKYNQHRKYMCTKFTHSMTQFYIIDWN